MSLFPKFKIDIGMSTAAIPAIPAIPGHEVSNGAGSRAAGNSNPPAIRCYSGREDDRNSSGIAANSNPPAIPDWLESRVIATPAAPNSRNSGNSSVARPEIDIAAPAEILSPAKLRP